MNFETLIKENGLENIYTTRNVRAQVNQAMANSELVMYYETCRVHSFVAQAKSWDKYKKQNTYKQFDPNYYYHTPDKLGRVFLKVADKVDDRYQLLNITVWDKTIDQMRREGIDLYSLLYGKNKPELFWNTDSKLKQGQFDLGKALGNVGFKTLRSQYEKDGEMYDTAELCSPEMIEYKKKQLQTITQKQQKLVQQLQSIA